MFLDHLPLFLLHREPTHGEWPGAEFAFTSTLAKVVLACDFEVNKSQQDSTWTGFPAGSFKNQHARTV